MQNHHTVAEHQNISFALSCVSSLFASVHGGLCKFEPDAPNPICNELNSAMHCKLTSGSNEINCAKRIKFGLPAESGRSCASAGWQLLLLANCLSQRCCHPWQCKVATPKVTCVLTGSHLGCQSINLPARLPACACAPALPAPGRKTGANSASSDIA